MIYDWTIDPAGLTRPVLTNPVNIFTDWNKTTPAQISASCVNLLKYAEDNDQATTLLQDLTWSYHGVLNSIVDSDLRKTVMDTLAPLTLPSKYTGPMALHVLLTHLTSCSPGVLHQIKARVFYDFDLGQVPGANVVKYNATILKTATFLESRGVDLADCPWRVVKAYKKGPPDFSLLFSSLEAQKHACLSNLRDLLARGQEKYEEELARNNWIPTPASGSQFYTPAPKPGSTPSGSTPGGRTPGGTTNQPPTHDARGNPIDRTPPPPGAPTTRTNPLTQREEQWCGNCPHGGRWGNHPTQDHATWQAERKRRNEARKKKKQDSAQTPAETPSQTPSTTQETPAPSRPPADSSGSGSGPLAVTPGSLGGFYTMAGLTNPGF
jgi:hypothetical protein